MKVTQLSAWHIRPWILGLGVLYLQCLPCLLHGQEPTATPEDLPESTHLPLHQVMQQFELKPGFELDLVATEPMVVDPVAMAFDIHGNAFVVEMIGYSERRHEKLGRVRRLSDTDGDGIMDVSVVFAQGLAWPTAVACYDGGVFVGATPDIFYFKDTDQDGVADLSRRVWTGFAADSAPFGPRQLNMQAMLNSFHWGPDNRIHGATGLSGGRVVSPLRPDMAPVSLRGRDFSFDPRTLDFRAEGGGAQHGMSFDAEWNKYVCSNSDHIQSVVYDPALAGVNPLVKALPARVSIAEDGPAAPVFRISPDEPWRVIRTRWRVAGAVSGPVEGGGTPSGYFTGATGVTIFTGDAWAETYRGDAWIADCGSNLVHRKQLIRQGPQFSARRPLDEQNTEFLRSSEHWFRPVQFANGPDGNLYVLDMHREIIEHPWSLPEGIKEHLNLNRGNDRGRIYRIRQAGAKPSVYRVLSTETPSPAEVIIGWLGHPNGWHRVTALRWFYENPQPALEVELRKMALHQARYHTRMDAWQVLLGWGKVSAADWLSMLEDPNEHVQHYGLRRLVSMEPGILDPRRWREACSRLVQQDRTRFDCLLALARHPLPPAQQAELLWEAMILEKKQKNWTEFAALNAAGHVVEALTEKVLNEVHAPYQALNDPGELFFMLGAHGDPAPIGRMASQLFELEANPQSWSMLVELHRGMQKAGLTWKDVMDDNIQRKRWLALQASLGDLGPSQVAKHPDLLRLIATALEPATKSLWMDWFFEDSWTGLRPMLFEVLQPSLNLRDFQVILDHWDELGPSVRPAILGGLLKVPGGARQLIECLAARPLLQRECPYPLRRRLIEHADASIASAAHQMFGQSQTPTNDQLAEHFSQSLLLDASLEKGEALFVERCASCHRANGQGHAVGPAMVTVKTSGKRRILDSILHPNREVQPQYMAYEILTSGDDEGLVGLIQDETATSLRLLQSGGVMHDIPRSRLVRMVPAGTSLMPEGLVSDLSVQQMADLLEYLVRVRQ